MAELENWQVYLDGRLVGTLDRRLKQESLALAGSARNAALDILIENSGRINSTRIMRHEQKGAPRLAGLTAPILGGAVQESDEP